MYVQFNNLVSMEETIEETDMEGKYFDYVCKPFHLHLILHCLCL